MCELSVHYIRTVPFTIHPSVNNFLWCALSFSDIFTSCTIRNTILLHHVKWRTICWTIVCKVTIGCHIFGFVTGYFTKLGVSFQWTYSLFSCLIFICCTFLGMLFILLILLFFFIRFLL